MLARELADALPEIAERIQVVPNAVDVLAFRAAPWTERHPEELLFVGYRRPSKGIGTLLEALALARRTRPALTLRLIGGASPADDATWNRRISDLGLAGTVSLEPAADRPAIADAMARAALFVHPSPRETFGVVAVEALASGLPVVATDSGGVTEILGTDPDQFGALVPVDDPERLAAAIVRTLDRPAMFDPVALRASALERYGAASVAERITGVYAEAIAASGGLTDAPPGRPAARSKPGRRQVVVAFNPQRAAILARLPAAARAELVVVASGQAATPPVPGMQAVVLTDLEGRVRTLIDAAAVGPRASGLQRWLRVARHPIAFARRRGLLPGLERTILTTGTAAIREALAAHAPDGTAELVPVDGMDLLAALPLIESGEALLAGGGLRWLGDRARSAEGSRD